MTPDEIECWAERLEAARASASPIAPLTEVEPNPSIADAYAIQRHGIEMRHATGRRLQGHKIGLTSQAVQEQLGVDQPDFGALLDDMEVTDGGQLPAGMLIAPRVELELAFHLREPLAGPGVTAEDVHRATRAVQPSIEIVDSRILDWRISLVDTIADNASSGAYVLGGLEVPIGDLDPTTVEVALRRDGETVETGRSDAVLGDPRAAVAWLANALATFGVSLQAGQVVLSGACTRMIAAKPGDAFVGDFGRLGTVSVRFAEVA